MLAASEVRGEKTPPDQLFSFSPRQSGPQPVRGDQGAFRGSKGGGGRDGEGYLDMVGWVGPGFFGAEVGRALFVGGHQVGNGPEQSWFLSMPSR